MRHVTTNARQTSSGARDTSHSWSGPAASAPATARGRRQGATITTAERRRPRSGATRDGPAEVAATMRGARNDAGSGGVRRSDERGGAERRRRERARDAVAATVREARNDAGGGGLRRSGGASARTTTATRRGLGGRRSLRPSVSFRGAAIAPLGGARAVRPRRGGAPAGPRKASDMPQTRRPQTGFRQPSDRPRTGLASDKPTSNRPPPQRQTSETGASDSPQTDRGLASDRKKRASDPTTAAPRRGRG